MSELVYSEEIRLKIKEEIGFCPTEIIPPSGFRVMIKLHVGEEFARLPDGTKSSIVRPDITKANDPLTQCVGMVISMNPGCYKDEERYKLTGPNCELGDWVVVPRGNAHFGILRGNHICHVFEDYVIQKLNSPEEYRRA